MPIRYETTEPIGRDAVLLFFVGIVLGIFMVLRLPRVSVGDD
jgi:hypothetical protein